MTVNLIEYSSTFPEVKLSPSIPLDSKIRELATKFGDKTQCVILAGPNGSGKTVHLMEFARRFHSTTFSYFLSDNFWVKRPSYFLTSLCVQMSALLGGDFHKRKLSDTTMDTEHLKQVFERYVEKILSLVKKHRQPFYFVIDGLEWALQGEMGARIIDLLPLRTSPRGLFILASARQSILPQIRFGSTVVEPHLFSSLETASYLKDLSLSTEDISRLHALSDGMPGYLATAKKLIAERRLSISQLLETPEQIEGLLQLQWHTSGVESGDSKRHLLALVAFAATPVTVEVLAEALDIPPDYVETALTSTGLVRRTEDGRLTFYPELLRSIAQSKLAGLREVSLRRLTEYYERHANERTAALLLPEYYRLAGNYEALTKWLVPSQLASAIQERKELTFAIRELVNASEMAKTNGDLYGMFGYGISGAHLRDLADKLIGLSEVRALVAMRRYDNALELAYSAKLTTTRIRLLAHIYIQMERHGQTVPRHDLSQLDQLAKELSDDTHPADLLQVASDLFPILPDTATRLVDIAKRSEASNTAIDLVFALSVSANSSGDGEPLFDRIKDDELRDLALIGTAWMSQLSAQEILQRAAQSNVTKTKEFLFRRWCIENRRNPEVHIVIQAALDAIVSDASYSIPIRYLRQLSEAVKFCDTSVREHLVRRFEVPSFTSLRSPIEERIRLDLNLAEAMLAISPSNAKQRAYQAYEDVVSSALDTDVACYCYARLLITFLTIDPDDTLGLHTQIRERLEYEFLNLLETCADQLGISRRTLRALTLIDPKLAVTFADMLNLQERRDAAYAVIVQAFVRQDRLPLSTDFVSDTLTRIFDIEVREEAIYDLIEAARDTGKLSDEGFRTYCAGLVSAMLDPVRRSRSLATLIQSAGTAASKEALAPLFEKLLEAWNQIDVTWMRVEAGFDMVADIASSDQDYAAELYETARQLRDKSPLASQAIGVMFYHTLLFGTRVIGRLELSDANSKQVWDEFLAATDRIPSQLLRTRVWSQLAIGRLRAGDGSTFSQLVGDRILPTLHQGNSSSLRNHITAEIALAIFEYSDAEAAKLLAELPYGLRNKAWVLLGMHILRNTNVGDPVDDDEPNASIDLPRANKILYILDKIDFDQSFSYLLTAFTHAIESERGTLSETQRLDLLVKLEHLASQKLPDIKNIKHPGYRIVCEAEIERARRLVAKRARDPIEKKKKHRSIAQDARALENIADRVFVLARVGAEFRNIDSNLSRGLLDEALELAPTIPNVRDRVERLETITEAYSKLKNTDLATEALRMAYKLVGSLEGQDRDSILASIIQTAHQIDADLAADLSETIEEPIDRRVVESRLLSLGLAKAPQRISVLDWAHDDDALGAAATKMLSTLLNERGVLHARSTVLEWLHQLRLLGVDSALSVAEWCVEMLIRQAGNTERQELAMLLGQSLLQSLRLIYEVGNNVAILSTIPEYLKSDLPTSSKNQTLIRVGERDKAVDWLQEWLRTNAKDFVKICDPHFDSRQLWILKCIPTNVKVTIVTTGEHFGIRNQKDAAVQLTDRNRIKRETERIGTELQRAWSQLSDQSPPLTLLVIRSSVFDEMDAFHDRYIITSDGGVSLGTSLNGMGNKDFLISVLAPEDAKHIQDIYIDPKLDITDAFSKAIFLWL